jgi:hypothetical protein
MRATGVSWATVRGIQSGLRTCSIQALIVFFLVTCAAAAARIDVRQGSGAGRRGQSSVGIERLTGRYDRAAGKITVRFRFFAPVRNPIPPGQTLGFSLGSRADFGVNFCYPRRQHDLEALLALGPTGSSGFRFNDERATEPMHPLAVAFSRDRKSVTATLEHSRLRLRDYRCVEGSSDTASRTDSEDVFAPCRKALATLKVRQIDRLGNRRRGPGSTQLRISWTPQPAPTIVVHAGNRRLFARRFNERRYPPRAAVQIPWRCTRPGRFRWKVIGKDEYGNRLVRRGSWLVTRNRCSASRL